MALKAARRVSRGAPAKGVTVRAASDRLAAGARRRAGARNQPSRSDVTLYDAGLHNRSRNRSRNGVHSRIWRSRDYFLSTPSTRKTAIVPCLKLSSSYAHVPGHDRRPRRLGRLTCDHPRTCVHGFDGPPKRAGKPLRLKKSRGSPDSTYCAAATRWGSRSGTTPRQT
jgi:hypothetical protein